MFKHTRNLHFIEGQLYFYFVSAILSTHHKIHFSTLQNSKSRCAKMWSEAKNCVVFSSECSLQKMHFFTQAKSVPWSHPTFSCRLLCILVKQSNCHTVSCSCEGAQTCCGICICADILDLTRHICPGHPAWTVGLDWKLSQSQEFCCYPRYYTSDMILLCRERYKGKGKDAEQPCQLFIFQLSQKEYRKLRS